MFAIVGTAVSDERVDDMRGDRGRVKIEMDLRNEKERNKM